jgi:hypothetical protein
VIDGVIMNKWRYRAAGTAGVAGGFPLLAAGRAQARPRAARALLSPVRSIPSPT